MGISSRKLRSCWFRRKRSLGRFSHLLRKIEQQSRLWKHGSSLGKCTATWFSYNDTKCRAISDAIFKRTVKIWITWQNHFRAKFWSLFNELSMKFTLERFIGFHCTIINLVKALIVKNSIKKLETNLTYFLHVGTVELQAEKEVANDCKTMIMSPEYRTLFHFLKNLPS